MNKSHITVFPFIFMTYLVILINCLSIEETAALVTRNPILLLERVSVNNMGEQGNDVSAFPVLSTDGRYVAFFSLATNLVVSDTNGFLGWDVFVYDRMTDQIELASVNSSGEQGNASSTGPDISADGRFVVFISLASNLVVSDTNGTEDAFVHDRETGKTTLISRSTTGIQGNSASYQAAISANGRFIAFASLASNLVTGDTNNSADVFVHDRLTGITERVSISSTGAQGFGYSESPYISGDGRFVTFDSTSLNLAPGGTGSGGNYHIFVRDRLLGETMRASVTPTGELANDSSFNPVISDDGRYVSFGSYATNLISFPVWIGAQNYVHDMVSGVNELISISPTGEPGNDYSAIEDMTPDGRFVAFGSRASNLVPGDTNGVGDMFVYDRWMNYMVRVSITPDGVESNGLSNGPSLSDDGSIVAFYSEGSNLVPGDTNSREDIFVVQWQLNHIWLPVIYKLP